MAFLSILNRRDGSATASPVADVQQLLSDIQDERRSLEAVLSPDAGNISAVRAALDDVEQRASALERQLDDLGSRAEQLGRTSRSVESLEARIAALEEGVRSAEARTDQTLQRTAEMEDQRWALHEMTALAQKTLTRLEALKGDPEITQLAEQVPVIREDCTRIREQHIALVNEANVLQATTTAVLQEATAAAQTSRDANDHADNASRQLDEFERRLEAAVQMNAVMQDTTSQFQTLNALAEHVSLKLKALEGQHQTIERVLVDSRRVNDMVWEMEVQIGKLNEGSTLASRVEEDLVRLERLYQEMAGKLEEVARGRTQLTETADEQQRDAVELLQSIQGHLDRLAVRQKEMDTLSERLRTAQAGLADAERRLASVSATERTMAALGDHVEILASRIGELTLQAKGLQDKQASLNLLEERLDDVDRATRHTTAQIEVLAERRKDLDSLKAAFDAFDATHAAARTLVDGLRNDKQEFARFVQHASEFMNAAPRMDAAIEELTTRVAETEAHAARAISMSPEIEDLTDRVTSLTPRLQIVDELQGRLSGLHELSAEIDRRLGAQLARLTEIEQMRVTCDGVATQTADAQHKLEALEKAQARLSPMNSQVVQLDADVTTARASLASLQRDQESIASQERRMAELHESARALTVELAGRLESMDALQSELAAAGTNKQELYSALAQLQALQREACAATRETDAQLHELASRWKQIEERRSQLTTVEQAVAAVESRYHSLENLADDVRSKIDALAERERIVEAVKQELETIHTISKKSQEDLAALAERRAEIADGRTELERLATALADATGKMADVERRSAAVDEVRRNADAVVCLLDDVRVTLDTVGEHKAIIDHVAEMLARLDDVISEARGTTKALQAERKLGQRIAENVRNIHARAGADIRQVG
jgi:chromosome segregation ATPase